MNMGARPDVARLTATAFNAEDAKAAENGAPRSERQRQVLTFSASSALREVRR
jgi:hypothetical protein